jgi:hypothetical protein
VNPVFSGPVQTDSLYLYFLHTIHHKIPKSHLKFSHLCWEKRFLPCDTFSESLSSNDMDLLLSIHTPNWTFQKNWIVCKRSIPHPFHLYNFMDHTFFGAINWVVDFWPIDNQFHFTSELVLSESNPLIEQVEGEV